LFHQLLIDYLEFIAFFLRGVMLENKISFEHWKFALFREFCKRYSKNITTIIFNGKFQYFWKKNKVQHNLVHYDELQPKYHNIEILNLISLPVLRKISWIWHWIKNFGQCFNCLILFFFLSQNSSPFEIQLFKNFEVNLNFYLNWLLITKERRFLWIELSKSKHNFLFSYT
jgi:hypothetical protein